MIRRPPRSTLFPYTRSSDLLGARFVRDALGQLEVVPGLHEDHLNPVGLHQTDRKSTRLNSSHLVISYAVFCLKKNIVDLVTFSSAVTNALQCVRSISCTSSL